MSDKKFENELYEIVGNYEATIIDTLNENKKDLKERIEKQLNDAEKKIVMHLLGFRTKDYAKDFEIDHCNGRSGNSPIGQELFNDIKETVMPWVKEIRKVQPTKKELNNFKKDYKNHLLREIKQSIWSKANADAEEIVSNLGDDILSSFKSIEELRNVLKS